MSIEKQIIQGIAIDGGVTQIGFGSNHRDAMGCHFTCALILHGNLDYVFVT